MPARNASALTREQILAFRVQRHNLARRLPGGSLSQAAAVCGIQNTPPGSALLSFHARLEGLQSAGLDRALLAEKALVQLWSVRSAPLLVPVEAIAIFTLGLLPASEDELRFWIRGACSHLDRCGLAASDLVNWTAAALDEALDGRSLAKDELGVVLSRRLVQHIPPACLALWDSPDEWGHFGESLVRFALNVVALRGAFCLIAQEGRASRFVRIDQWLGKPLAAASPASAGRATTALLRHYLATYGPTTRTQFAQWAGVSPGQAQRMWRLIEDELAPVQCDGRTVWLLAADLPDLRAAALPEGVRLLPPHDAYLAGRDRSLLLPDKRLHAQIWRAVGAPGGVLINGAIVGTWRAQKKNDVLHLAVEPFCELTPPARSAIETEAGAVAQLRGCKRVAVTLQA